MEAGQNVLRVAGAIDPSQPFTDLQMADGRTVRVATELLMPQQSVEPGLLGEVREEAGGALVVPVLEESLTVGKRTVETGKVRLHKTVEEFEQAIDESLAVHTFEVERVAIDRVIEARPSVRQEGTATIYPVVEERLVLAKQLVLREELRVTERAAEVRDNRVVTLKREQVDVERTPALREGV